ncbi:MAG: SDR family oxidoreductase [Victivallales bacterium]|nr:SDR family oxidoreductase [Victivallales bacterium]
MKRVLITGAARRIGRAIAEAFAAEGYAVVVHCHHSSEEASALAEDLKQTYCRPEIRAVSCDLTAADAPARLMDDVLSDGGLDVLVNNASVYRRGTLASLSPELLDGDLDINFRAPFELMRCYRNRCSSGCIINLLDYRVRLADPASAGYAIAKKALADVSEAAALEWAPSFRVNAIAPGIVIPPEGVPKERMQRLIDKIPTRCRTTESDVAKAALFLAETPSVNGQILYLDGGLHLLGADFLGERRRE